MRCMITAGLRHRFCRPDKRELTACAVIVRCIFLMIEFIRSGSKYIMEKGAVFHIFLTILLQASIYPPSVSLTDVKPSLCYAIQNSCILQIQTFNPFSRKVFFFCNFSQKKKKKKKNINNNNNNNNR